MGGILHHITLQANCFCLARYHQKFVYGEVGYRHNKQWILPRKPTLWYEKFAENISREGNKKEVHIEVEENEAVSIEEVSLQDVKDGSCRQIGKKLEGYGFDLEMHTCGNTIQFQIRKGDRKNETKAFRFSYGTASIIYSVEKGLRRINGEELDNVGTVEFPEPNAFWNEMGKCFLNALTFNSPEKEASIPFLDRVIISGWIRVDWIKGKHIGGFSHPPKMVEASVREVVTSNIRFAVVIIVLGCCVVLVTDAAIVVFTN